MFKKNRFTYFLIIILVIILGILSRKINGFPSFVGDALYAVMVYFGIRFLSINLTYIKTVLLALLFCYCIEFFQLYRAEWIVAVRRTPLGHYALGQGFLWSDLGYYLLGVTVAYSIDFLKNKLSHPLNSSILLLLPNQIEKKCQPQKKITKESLPNH
ncbi:ribosomal maturation YjgA family protein [Flavobacterium psychrotolerans]|uniref:DUF2809 domain-containing protein n=1 Tax=Flavobacterium psychrotolerans TaxID=2169410 RepID=A0A2U1JHV7_9FLAO|nr:DUF2809 domain-containing protein [Flavobacterium psychrotolerans]PWA04707.1 DUF2809 domain-containing protein [Flavobacterium psychrotolerans]